MSKLSGNSDHCLTILKKLYLIRDIEECIAAKYSEGKMRCPTHLSIGQEGAPAALSALLSHQDFAVSTHRAHAHYLAKGGCPQAMLAEIYGKATGCSGGRGGSMHLIDESVGFKGSTAIVGNTIPIGVGLALSQKMRKKSDVTIVYLGDGAVEEGSFYESANFAALQQLPVIFVCENNLYSVYTGLDKRQPKDRKIHELAQAIGLNSFSGDGNDVVSNYDVFHHAVEQTRQGKGPCFIELSTYRWREHCGPNYDNNIGYRSENEFIAWQKKEPISRFEHWLLENELVSRNEMKLLRAEVNDLITQAFAFAENSPFPEQSTLTQHVYCETSHES
jgi:pyruvate dehydrogenase E1 component alpha subunit